VIYLWEIRDAIATLRRAGIEPDSFSVTAETAAEVESAGLKVTSITESDKVPVMTLRTKPMTLAGVPLRVRP